MVYQPSVLPIQVVFTEICRLSPTRFLRTPHKIKVFFEVVSAMLMSRSRFGVVVSECRRLSSAGVAGAISAPSREASASIRRTGSPSETCRCRTDLFDNRARRTGSSGRDRELDRKVVAGTLLRFAGTHSAGRRTSGACHTAQRLHVLAAGAAKPAAQALCRHAIVSTYAAQQGHVDVTPCRY